MPFTSQKDAHLTAQSGLSAFTLPTISPTDIATLTALLHASIDAQSYAEKQLKELRVELAEVNQSTEKQLNELQADRRNKPLCRRTYSIFTRTIPPGTSPSIWCQFRNPQRASTFI